MKNSRPKKPKELLPQRARKPVTSLYERYLELLRLREQIKLLAQISPRRRSAQPTLRRFASKLEPRHDLNIDILGGPIARVAVVKLSD
jgi:hypothetical protein